MCKCWGDPHCTRFNGSTFDEYDVDNFTLVHSNMSMIGNGSFSVRMETEGWGAGNRFSVASKIFLDFFNDSNGNKIATVEFDRHGNSYFRNVTNGTEEPKEPLVEGIDGNGFKFKFIKIDKWMQISTDFGVEVTMDRLTVTIRVPYTQYRGNVYGICGNFGAAKNTSCVGEPTNRKRPKRQTQPFECNNEDIIDECENMFEAPWMAPCKALIFTTRLGELVDACKVDYCIDPTIETKIDLIGQFISECREIHGKNSILLHDWREMLPEATPKCKENQDHKGCANKCDFVTCQDLLNDSPACIPDGITFDACICSPGHVLLNGDCVQVSVCEQPGWSKWNTWSGCTAKESTRQRTRACHGNQCPRTAECEVQNCTNGKMYIL